MKQMPLFSAEAEAERTLREQMQWLGADYAELEGRYLALMQEHRALQTALQAKQRELDAARDDARYRLKLAMARHDRQVLGQSPVWDPGAHPEKVTHPGPPR